jgi:GNAT superfamily N-acetyltransferase
VCILISFNPVSPGDAEHLATLRVDAMRESLERAGRFDPDRARARFLDNFSPEYTRDIVEGDVRVGFFVVRPEGGALLLDHLYVHPSRQGRGIGAAVLRSVFADADARGLEVRVGALRGSDSNLFYIRHGFEMVSQAEFDNYYVRRPQIRMHEEPVSDLREHATIPSVFEANSVFDVRASDTGFELVERSIAPPYRKNYDQFEDPSHWPRDFDTSRWVRITAFCGAPRTGGIIVAMDSPGVAMCEGRSDLAVLWDLRVAVEHRRRSVASELFRAAQTWALRRGCTEIKVETQNTNPAACKFYMQNGFVLSEAQAGAYRELPDEVRLIWRKSLKVAQLRYAGEPIQEAIAGPLDILHELVVHPRPRA